MHRIGREGSGTVSTNDIDDAKSRIMGLESKIVASVRTCGSEHFPLGLWWYESGRNIGPCRLGISQRSIHSHENPFTFDHPSSQRKSRSTLATQLAQARVMASAGQSRGARSLIVKLIEECTEAGFDHQVPLLREELSNLPS